eukprot:4594150-Pleurochrysis_carterae.AAC.1
MSYKWGNPVATLPVTNGTAHHLRRMTEIMRIKRRSANRSMCVNVGRTSRRRRGQSPIRTLQQRLLCHCERNLHCRRGAGSLRWKTSAPLEREGGAESSRPRRP